MKRFFIEKQKVYLRIMWNILLGLDLQFIIIGYIDIEIIYFIKVRTADKHSTDSSVFAAKFHLSTIMGECQQFDRKIIKQKEQIC